MLEETGYDITSKLVETDYIDAQLGDQDTRLFIVRGVDESTPFAPHVRYEIGAFGWHLVGHLPSTWDESKHQFVTEAGNRHRFFNVWPYIKPLRAWIHRRVGSPEQKLGALQPALIPTRPAAGSRSSKAGNRQTAAWRQAPPARQQRARQPRRRRRARQCWTSTLTEMRSRSIWCSHKGENCPPKNWLGL